MIMRALRFAVIELLREYIDFKNITSYSELSKMLDELSSKSFLAEKWIENLIKPVFIMMMYLKAEREEDFGLHLA